MAANVVVDNENLTNVNLTYLCTAGVDNVVDWLKSAILTNVDPSQVRYLGVGNEVVRKDPLYISNLVPAMRNLHKALQNPGLEKQIKL